MKEDKIIVYCFACNDLFLITLENLAREAPPICEKCKNQAEEA